MIKAFASSGYFLLILCLFWKCNGEVKYDCTDSDESSDESDEKQSYCATLRSGEDLANVGQDIGNACDTSGAIYSCSDAKENFTCNSAGRFPDLADSTCMKYFQCDKLSDGTFNQQLIKCPTSQFCPSTQKCSYQFVCPCNKTPSSVGTSTSSLSASTSATSTTSGCIVPTKKFNCTVGGRFPDLSDVSCRKYFLCSKLRNETFVKTLYRCLQSSFNPLTHRCSVSYTCPCSNVQTTLKTTEIVSELTTLPVVSTTSKQLTTMSVVITEGTTVIPDVTTAKYSCSSAPDEYGEFNCTTKGRFPDFSDPLCQKYFLCSYLQNGTFIKTNYKCLNSVFDSSTGRCTTKIVCPCSESTSTTSSTATSQEVSSTSSEAATTSSAKPEVTSTTEGVTTATPSYTCSSAPDEYGEFICTTKGRFPDFSDPLCQKYFLCSYLQNGTFIKTNYKCLNSVFDSSTGRCTTQIVCPCSESTSTTSSTAATSQEASSASSEAASTTSAKPEVTSTTEGVTTTTPSYTCSSAPNEYGSFDCTSKGRYPDFADPSCQKYFLCSLLQNGTFVRTNYKCLNSVFDPVLKRCSIETICPCGITTSSRVTTESVTQTSPINATEENTKVPSETTSASLTTVTISTDPIITTTSSTSTSSPIQPTTLNSTYSSVDETTSTSVVTSLGTEASNASSSTGFGCIVPYRQFICTREGRFPDFSDGTCRKYFLCSHLRNETFIKTSYMCLNSFFSPLIFRCSLSYMCPCKEDQSSVITTPLSSVPPLSEGFTTVLPRTSTPVSSSTTIVEATTSYSCLPPSANTPEYICEATGRFPDYSDNTCRRYFLCSQLHNGTFIKTSYNCPISSCIKESIHRCSSECICPCLL